MTPNKISDLMLMNLNDDAIKQYKKNIGITKEYKGNLKLIKWKDELAYLENIADVEDKSEEEDVINSDMESEEEYEVEESILV